MLLQYLDMHWREMWSGDRVGTTLRTRGWHQRAVLWDNPEVLQMHSGFIQAAGLIQRGRVWHLTMLAGHIEDAKHGGLTSYDHSVFQVQLVFFVWRPLPSCCVVFAHVYNMFRHSLDFYYWEDAVHSDVHSNHTSRSLLPLWRKELHNQNSAQQIQIHLAPVLWREKK